MNNLADLLNAPTEMEFETPGGAVQKYRLRQPTLLECAEYQRHLEQEARAAAGRATELPDADRRQLLRDVTADIAANRYRFGGLVCVESLQTVDGIAKLMSIICRDQGMTEEIARQLCERKLVEIIAVIQGANDPEGKVTAALLTSLGLPPNFLNNSSSASATPRSEAPPTSAPSAGSASDRSSGSTP